MEGLIRILVADDHPVVREGLISMLETQPDFRVVGEAENGSQVIRRIPSKKPDIVLMDLEMPDTDGVEALRQIRSEYPDVDVIVFTAFDTDDRILSAVQAGARGYILKGSPRAELFEAIRVVNAGGSLLQPVIASKLLNHIREPDSRDPSLIDPLTDREMEVLNLLGQGLPNKEIASRLVITERTVKFHVSSILGKLGVGNRTEAVTTAAQLGLIDL
jgi:DNA-binding NarL/FixJ family response regulator